MHVLRFISISYILAVSITPSTWSEQQQISKVIQERNETWNWTAQQQKSVVVDGNETLSITPSTWLEQQQISKVLQEKNKTLDVSSANWTAQQQKSVVVKGNKTYCFRLIEKKSEQNACYMKNGSQIRCPKWSKLNDSIVKLCQPLYSRAKPNVTYTCSKDGWHPRGRKDECRPDCGVSTKINNHPWVVAIYDKRAQLICGGTIISSFHVVTAISCFTLRIGDITEKELVIRDPGNYTIIAGIYSLDDMESAQIRNIRDYYTQRALKFDSVTLVVLEVEQLVFVNDVVPACLDWYNDYELDFTDGNEGIAFSWVTRNGTLTACENSIQYWQSIACLENAPDSLIGSQTFCGIPADENSTCGRIKGAGLLFKSTSSRYYLKGVTIDFYPNMENTTHIFYTKVAPYHEWFWSTIIRSPNAPPYAPGDSEVSDEINPTGCRLPDHIKYGRFKMIAGTTYKVGNWVQSKTEILLECDNTRDNSILCSHGEWVPAIDKLKCKKLDCGIGRLGADELSTAHIDAIQHEFPWVVGIHRSEKLVCSGTIIGELYVLSAADCFSNSTGQLLNNISEFTVTAGTSLTKFEPQELVFQTRTVSGVNIPLQMNTHNNVSLPQYYNIALIKVNAKFVPTLRIQPICLDWGGLYEDEDLVNGNYGAVTGWESNLGNSSGKCAQEKILKKLELIFLPKGMCKAKFFKCCNQIVSRPEIFCVGPVNAVSDVCDTCVAGSGAGLFFKSKGDRYYIRGITGANAGCLGQHLELFTKVSHYLPWIRYKTRGKL